MWLAADLNFPLTLRATVAISTPLCAFVACTGSTFLLQNKCTSAIKLIRIQGKNFFFPRGICSFCHHFIVLSFWSADTDIFKVWRSKTFLGTTLQTAGSDLLVVLRPQCPNQTVAIFCLEYPVRLTAETVSASCGCLWRFKSFGMSLHTDW
jgi:hypothetical protein